MNSRFLRILVLCSAMLLLLGMACSSIPFLSQPTPTATVILHYQDKTLAFDYPSNWNIYPPGDPAFNIFPDVDKIQPGGERVIALADPARFANIRYQDSAVSIYRYAGMPEADLDHFLEGVYQDIRPTYGYEKDLKPVLIDSIPAIQKKYSVFVGEPRYSLQDLWFQKDDALFRVTVLLDYHTREDEAEFNSQVKIVLDSLEIADNLPPL